MHRAMKKKIMKMKNEFHFIFVLFVHKIRDMLSKKKFNVKKKRKKPIKRRVFSFLRVTVLIMISLTR